MVSKRLSYPESQISCSYLIYKFELKSTEDSILNYTTPQQIPSKMQAALCFAPPPLCPLTPSKNLSTLRSSPLKLAASRRSSSIKATAAVAYDTSSTFDYSSTISVFPAEACETIGGDDCLADIYPEVKLQTEARRSTRMATEFIDKEYLDYTDSKTVFRGEACDALGGNFCGREYQRGVY